MGNGNQNYSDIECLNKKYSAENYVGLWLMTILSIII